MDSEKISKRYQFRDYQQFLLQHLANDYGITQPKLIQFVGYDNVNIKVECQNQLKLFGKQFVAKIYRDLPQIELEILKAENEYLNYLDNAKKESQSLSSCKYCHPIPSNNGQYMLSFKIKDGSIWSMRLLTFVEGDLLIQTKKIGKKLLDKLIEEVYYLIQYSLRFYHETLATREWQFQIKYFLKTIYEQRKSYAEQSLLELVEYYIPKIKKLIEDQSQIRLSFIHGDLNRRNITVKDSQQGLKIGFFDFSDVIQTFMVNEISNFLAYHCVELSSLQEAVQQIQYVIVQFSKKMPFTLHEVQLCYWLIFGRLCNSVINSTYRSKFDPENQYILVDKPLIVKFLNLFKDFKHQDLIQKIKYKVIEQKGIFKKVQQTIDNQQLIISWAQKFNLNNQSIIAVQKLPGYETFNYKIKTENKNYVLKVENKQITAIKWKQKKCLMNMLRYAEELKEKNNRFHILQAVCPTNHNQSYIQSSYNPYTIERVFLRMFKFMPGQILMNYMNKLNLNLQQDLIKRREVLNGLGKGLANFHKDFLKYQGEFIGSTDRKWVIQFIDSWEGNCLLIANQQIREISLSFIHSYKQKITMNKDLLRRGIIHNDFSRDNVLVFEKQKSINFSLIDFEDSVKSYLIADLATMLAHCLGCKTEFQDKVSFISDLINVIMSYHNQLPLTQPQIESIYCFTGVRLALALGNIEQDSIKNPQNQHINKFEEQLTIKKLNEIPENIFIQKLKEKLSIIS